MLYIQINIQRFNQKLQLKTEKKINYILAKISEDVIYKIIKILRN